MGSWLLYPIYMAMAYGLGKIRCINSGVFSGCDFLKLLRHAMVDRIVYIWNSQLCIWLRL